jgi:RimJ/RimL family protein N-acetyltransferase
MVVSYCGAQAGPRVVHPLRRTSQIRMPPGHDENRDDDVEARRWWSRLRPNPTHPVATDGHPEVEPGEVIREGERVRLRRHTVENRPAFQRWYADDDIARLLRHDLRPLTPVQSLVYFDTVILPSSARGLSLAIHDRETDELIGTTGLTDVDQRISKSCYFRILIGESRYWNHGYGTEATRMMMSEAFERHGLESVKLEVFDYNHRAIAAYQRVGFHMVGEHTEWPEAGGGSLHVLEMRLDKADFLAEAH